MYNNYGFWWLMFDIAMTCFTGGLWLIVILIVFMRRNTKAKRQVRR